MSIFGTIMSKVFGENHPAASVSPTDQKPAADTSTAPSTTSAAEKTEKSNTWEQAPTNAPAPAGASASAPATAPDSVDIEAKLDGMEGHAGQELDWRHSIVDLMKLLGMDSSLSSRKELAKELHYDGDTDDSASMNIWLHKQVMAKFAQNGGKLPQDLAAK